MFAGLNSMVQVRKLKCMCNVRFQTWYMNTFWIRIASSSQVLSTLISCMVDVVHIEKKPFKCFSWVLEQKCDNFQKIFRPFNFRSKATQSRSSSWHVTLFRSPFIGDCTVSPTEQQKSPTVRRPFFSSTTGFVWNHPAPTDHHGSAQGQLWHCPQTKRQSSKARYSTLGC